MGTLNGTAGSGTLTERQQKEMARLYRRATAYEVAARLPDGRLVLCVYCHSKSHVRVFEALTDDKRFWAVKALFPAVQGNGSSLIMAFEKWNWSAETLLPGEAAITGRTHQQAIMEGELPYIVTVAEEMAAEAALAVKGVQS